MPDEQFSNNASTTLSAAITDSATSISVASAAGFPAAPQYRILVDSELMLVTGGAGTTTWIVTRGVEGTTAAAHDTGVGVTHILTAAAVKNIPDYARKDLLTSKGDLYVAAGAATLERLPVGSNGQVLQADSAETTGIKWAAAQAGAPSDAAYVTTAPNASLSNEQVLGTAVIMSGTFANRPAAAI